MSVKKISVLILFIAICAATAYFSRNLQTPEGLSKDLTWMSIVPPLLAVTLALVTERLALSLAIAVATGGVLSGSLEQGIGLGSVAGLGRGANYLWSSVSDPINLQILAFVILVMALITLVILSGGILAIVQNLMRYAKGPRMTQILTALLGVAIFIDDYTNTMVVGSAMRPMADKNRVSREKLSYLVDATSAPVSGLAVISTWIGYEVGLFDQAAKSLGIDRDGYSIFFDALGFRFYCILTIGFVLINVLTGRDFGPMAKAERRALVEGKVAADDAKPLTSQTYSLVECDENARSCVWSAILPFGALFAILLGGLWWDGGGFSQSISAVLSFTAWREVISAAENNILILSYAAGGALGVAVVTTRTFANLSWSKIGRGVLAGVKSSLLPVMILTLAWSLKAACDDLQTGPFLTAAIGGVLSPLWFPAVLFLVAALTAFATGTSWGTMAILIPTAAPLAYNLDGASYGLTVIMSLAAILDGAIFGDHCSPISDTTIMSSISTSCDHLHHVRTQMPYAVAVGTLAIVCGYLPAALGYSGWITLPLALVLIVALHFGLGTKFTDFSKKPMMSEVSPSSG